MLTLKVVMVVPNSDSSATEATRVDSTKVGISSLKSVTVIDTEAVLASGREREIIIGLLHDVS